MELNVQQRSLEVKKAVIGKDECIIKAMAAILAGGHILIEDIPGVGKTTLALAFAKSMGMTRRGYSLHRMFCRQILRDFLCIDRSKRSFVISREQCSVTYFLQMKLIGRLPKHSQRFWK